MNDTKSSRYDNTILIQNSLALTKMINQSKIYDIILTNTLDILSQNYSL